MEYYSLKGHGSTNDYMMIMREMDEGFVIRIVRDLDGYEDVTTDFMSKTLFDSCVRTGYLTKIATAEKLVVNAWLEKYVLYFSILSEFSDENSDSA